MEIDIQREFYANIEATIQGKEATDFEELSRGYYLMGNNKFATETDEFHCTRWYLCLYDADEQEMLCTVPVGYSSARTNNKIVCY